MSAALYGFVTFYLIVTLLIVKFLQFLSTDYDDFSPICHIHCTSMCCFTFIPSLETIRPLLHAVAFSVHINSSDCTN